MKYFLIICLGLMACNDEPKNSAEASKPIEQNQATAPEKEDRSDTAVLPVSREVLLTLRNKEFIKLAGFFHPEEGVRFSPYGFVDTVAHRLMKSNEFVQAIASGARLYWGSYDGSGDSILLTVARYYNKFIYNADFLNADTTGINKQLGHGNSLNNIDVIYRGCVYTESHFRGFDVKYGGMDWTSLRLVFKSYRGKNYLVAIIHDQWTI